MIKVGELGIEPIQEALDGIINDWIDNGLIKTESTIVEVDTNVHGDRIEIVLRDGGHLHG